MCKALRELQRRNPFLALPAHDLFSWVQECETALRAGREDQAKDILHRIELEVEQEESTLTAAFNLFKPQSTDALTEREVKVMLEYLGFPAAKQDVDKLIMYVDTDGDRKVSLVEFQQYVGKMGGSFKLFEVRRKQTAATSGSSGSADPAALKMDLIQAGIQNDAQAYWRLVVPVSELEAAARMTECQKQAIRHIRNLAQRNHQQALPKLQKRCLSLGYTADDLWMSLAYIREIAPILVHINLTKMMPFLEKDTHYRNQFETATSGGLLKPAVRQKWERDLFGGSYDKAEPFQRPKYGVLNAMNDYRGVVKCAQYGDSYLVLKDVRLRCTFSPEDSANLKAERLAVLDYYAHVLQEYSNDELKETMKVANSSEAALLGDSSKVGAMKYKEAQLHGAISFANDVERLVANTKHRNSDKKRIEAICKRHGWKLSWMDQERKRMEAEEKEKLGADAWKERLAALMEKGVPDAKDVPPGLCRKGCGRPIAPGKTRKGKAFTSCCRGCVMGFGHDLHCGNIDPKLLGDGMCKNGCGRAVCPGATPAGRAFDTCCRGCSRGAHDAFCGSDGGESNLEPGMCKIGCGRMVAKSKDGRVFDTCCRGCATGKAHSPACEA